MRYRENETAFTLDGNQQAHLLLLVEKLLSRETRVLRCLVAQLPELLLLDSQRAVGVARLEG